MEGSSDLSLLGENFEMGRMKDDEHESRSGSDNFGGASGDDQDVGEETPQTQRKKKKYHRHTPVQIQELETFFKECPHPDEKQRIDLSNRLGLANKQVKFWFQNRRTQMKTQLERHENIMLKQENDKLRAENSLMKDAIANPGCQTCGGVAIPGQIAFDEHQVRIENARLKDELNRICTLANKFIGRALSPLVGPIGFPSTNSSLDLAIGMNGFAGPSNHGMVPLPIGHDFGEGLMGTPPPAMPGIVRPPMGLMGNQIQNERAMLIELAMVAMEELIKMAQPDSPLWVKSSDGRKEVLNQEEYARMTAPPYPGPKPNGYVTEATRESGLVIGNCLGLVEILTNADQWSEIFPSIVARAVTLEVISTGIPGNKNGAMQVIHAEVQLPSPLVPVRQLTFIRYCKQHTKGLWAVVDVSVDIGHNPTNSTHPIMNCWRMPSGCIMQDTSNGLSKVTWIEHNQYDENAIHHLYRPLISLGIGFGAQRWIASLQRQSECLATLISPPNPTEDATGMSLAGKTGMVKLAQRITNSFFTGVCASAAHQWESLHFDALDDNMKLMARKNVVGEPTGIVLSAATSVWMPVSQQRLFDFLRDERFRGEWDVLANNGPMQQLFRISKGQGNGNCVSVLRSAANGTESRMLVLQDAWTDSSSSVVVYVAVDVDSMNVVMSGGESAYFPLLPSGFIIHPDGRSGGNINGNGNKNGGGGGSLLTVGLQILLSSLPNANKLSLESIVSVSNLIIESIQKIKVALRVA